VLASCQSQSNIDPGPRAFTSRAHRARAKTNKNKQTQPQVLYRHVPALSCRPRESPIYSGSVGYIAWIDFASCPLGYEPMHTKNRFEFPVSAIQGSMEGTTTKRGRKRGVQRSKAKVEARRKRRDPRFIVPCDRPSPRGVRSNPGCMAACSCMFDTITGPQAIARYDIRIMPLSSS
jgi:hypothetical protein